MKTEVNENIVREMEQLEQEEEKTPKVYHEVHRWGRRFVVCEFPKSINRHDHERPHFVKKDWALCGILRDGQTLEEWVAEFDERENNANKKAEKMYRYFYEYERYKRLLEQ